MSFLSSIANLFRSKPEQIPEPSTPEQKKERPSLYVPPTEESNDEHATVFETMLQFLDLPENERKEMAQFVRSSSSALEAIKEVFTKFNLQGRMKWTEFDYWMAKLGEERLCSLSYLARMFLCGGSEGFVYEPITRESIKNHEYPLSKLKIAAETVGMSTNFKRSWKSFESFFASLSESDKDCLLEEASRMHRRDYLEWKEEHPGPDKIGEYWLYQAFYLAILSRANSLRYMRMDCPILEMEYPDATSEETQDWIHDKECPWQETYGQKNPFAISFQRIDREKALGEIMSEKA